MSTRQTRCAASRRRNEPAILRRAVERWLATGTPPVAHIVADLNEYEDAPAALRAVPDRSAPNAAYVAHA